MQHALINLSIVYTVIAMQTLAYISCPSLEGVNKEANNVTSTEYQNIIQVVRTNLN